MRQWQEFPSQFHHRISEFVASFAYTSDRDLLDRRQVHH